VETQASGQTVASEAKHGAEAQPLEKKKEYTKHVLHVVQE
jgi:hypothetical protein